MVALHSLAPPLSQIFRPAKPKADSFVSSGWIEKADRTTKPGWAAMSFAEQSREDIEWKEPIKKTIVSIKLLTLLWEENC